MATDMKDSYPGSFSVSTIPSDTYLSPAFLFAWWDGVIRHAGGSVALYDKGPDFKVGRELWIAAIFASAMRQSSGTEHWVKPVKDNAPDAIVAYFPKHERGFAEMKYSLEITTYGKYSESIKSVLKAKLDMNYPSYTRIVCYISDRQQSEDIDINDLRKFVSENNPHGFDVWVIGSADDPKDDGENPLRVDCLTSRDRFDVFYSQASREENSSPAFRITGLGTNEEGPKVLRSIRLTFPEPGKHSSRPPAS